MFGKYGRLLTFESFWKVREWETLLKDLNGQLSDIENAYKDEEKALEAARELQRHNIAEEYEQRWVAKGRQKIADALRHKLSMMEETGRLLDDKEVRERARLVCKYLSGWVGGWVGGWVFLYTHTHTHTHTRTHTHTHTQVRERARLDGRLEELRAEKKLLQRIKALVSEAKVRILKSPLCNTCTARYTSATDFTPVQLTF
jgi:hypothetical protein